MYALRYSTSFHRFFVPNSIVQGEGQAEYKIYMKQKIMREKWENGLLLYRMREGDRDKAGMAEVSTLIARLALSL